jgi:hypothetical protein
MGALQATGTSGYFRPVFPVPSVAPPPGTAPQEFPNGLPILGLFVKYTSPCKIFSGKLKKQQQ